jgi:uncharacterized metal-binding protein
MPVITFLFSLVARKANDIIQAVFGWSVTALFGRLRRRAQVLVTGALVLSLVWPIFVIGVAAPHVSSWVIALAPMHHWLSDTTLRIIWSSLAVVVPLIVGLLIHLAAPKKSTSAFGTILRGYPIALGFALAFATVVITVPIIKIASLARRWSDEHVYVQPHDGKYDEVLACLVDATRAAGLDAQTSDAPKAMVLATSIMRAFAGGVVNPFVADKLQRVTAPGLEMYLYPGDLLLRGKPFEVARVRAMLTRTKLDASAYLVDSDAGKAMQEKLSDIAHHLDTDGSSKADEVRLQRAYAELLKLEVTFEEWTVLDGIARKLERRMAIDEHLPLDRVAESPARTARFVG